jgi:hypothetical protein
MTSKRSLVILLAVVVIAVAGVIFWWSRAGEPGADTSPGAAANREQAPPRSPLALRINLQLGGEGQGGVLVATLYDRIARQAALDRDANAAVPPPAGLAAPATPAATILSVPRDAWPARLVLNVVEADGSRRRVDGLVVRDAPEPPVTLEPSRSLDVRLEVPAAVMPPAGATLVATFTDDGRAVDSNTLEVPAANAGAGLIAEARAARMLGDIDRLDRAAAAIEQAMPTSLQAPYYRGLVQQARGDRAAALQSFEEALRRFGQTPHAEPPTELLRLIRSVRPR